MVFLDAPDLSGILAAIDFGDMDAAVLGIAALLAGVAVIALGAQAVLAFIENRADDREDAAYEEWRERQ